MILENACCDTENPRHNGIGHNWMRMEGQICHATQYDSRKLEASMNTGLLLSELMISSVARLALVSQSRVHAGARRGQRAIMKSKTAREK
jgi:hypothetical protein